MKFVIITELNLKIKSYYDIILFEKTTGIIEIKYVFNILI